MSALSPWLGFACVVLLVTGVRLIARNGERGGPAEAAGGVLIIGGLLALGFALRLQLEP